MINISYNNIGDWLAYSYNIDMLASYFAIVKKLYLIKKAKLLLAKRIVMTQKWKNQVSQSALYKRQPILLIMLYTTQ